MAGQPATNREKQELQQFAPEGDQSNQIVKLWGTTQLLPADKATMKPADQFDFEGDRYLVIASTNWNNIGGYFKNFGTKIQEQ